MSGRYRTNYNLFDWPQCTCQLHSAFNRIEMRWTFVDAKQEWPEEDQLFGDSIRAEVVWKWYGKMLLKEFMAFAVYGLIGYEKSRIFCCCEREKVPIRRRHDSPINTFANKIAGTAQSATIQFKPSWNCITFYKTLRNNFGIMRILHYLYRLGMYPNIFTILCGPDILFRNIELSD